MTAEPCFVPAVAQLTGASAANEVLTVTMTGIPKAFGTFTCLSAFTTISMARGRSLCSQIRSAGTMAILPSLFGKRGGACRTIRQPDFHRFGFDDRAHCESER